MVKRVYTTAEKFAYVEEFKESGMSRYQFIKEKGIPESTFRGWLKLDRTSTFGEIELKPAIEKISEAVPIVPKLRDGIVFEKEDMRIELKQGFDKELLKRIVEVLIDAN